MEGGMRGLTWREPEGDGELVLRQFVLRAQGRRAGVQSLLALDHRQRVVPRVTGIPSKSRQKITPLNRQTELHDYDSHVLLEHHRPGSVRRHQELHLPLDGPQALASQLGRPLRPRRVRGALPATERLAGEEAVLHHQHAVAAARGVADGRGPALLRIALAHLGPAVVPHAACVLSMRPSIYYARALREIEGGYLCSIQTAFSVVVTPVVGFTTSFWQWATMVAFLGEAVV